MPGLVRKLLIFAAIDGLVLQPLVQKGQKQAPSVQIAYNGGAIGPALVDGTGHGNGFEAFGVVGLLNVSNSSYLISITRRQLVAHIHGKPIFVVTEVALTPLSSRKEAETAVDHTQTGLQKRAIDKNALDESDSDEDEGEFSAAVSDDVDDEEIPPTDAKNALIVSTIKEAERVPTSSIAEDVITRKGGYGRFARKWFSGKGWTVNQRRNLGMSVGGTETFSAPATASLSSSEPQKSDTLEAPAADDPKESSAAKARDIAATLLPKLLRTARLLFGSSRSFFFSYDHDITRNVANRKPPHGSEVPIHKDVDPLFFWNRNMIQPFIDTGQYSFVLPLMQGFIGQRSFVVEKHPVVPPCPDDASSNVLEMRDMSPEADDNNPEPVSLPDNATSLDWDSDQSGAQTTDTIPENVKSEMLRSARSDDTRSFLLTLISRRSVKRAGLRYLRRGVDDEGNTANTVETEQILSNIDWSPTDRIYSFVQVRGSIPLFFSQSPYSFKPVPQLQQSAETNFRAFKNHFFSLSARYGSLQVASLVEKHGSEAQVGEEYEKNMARLNEDGGIESSKIGFEWFDFHAMCRGMKFENVSILLDSLGDTLDAFGTTIEADNKLLSKQAGVLRTNCMDCLDRTNVVQSACGRRALEGQLREEGIDLGIQADQTTEWFNTLWADNGDAISKQYASTAALKGDFTRTRKRNYKGALTDMGLSISRFYSGIVNDYFSQAAIDFLLGNVTSLVFEDFESNLMSSDPGVSMRKVRQQAIEVSQRLVIANDHEELIGGWALLIPHEPNTVKSTPFEESVLLLTNAALYACRFDWNMEKVSSFERVDLRHISKIRYGTYITSTLSASQADEQHNVGFVVNYRAGADDITRVNTRSMSTTPTREESDLPSNPSLSVVTAMATALSMPKATGKKPAAAVAGDTRIVAFKALPARSAVAEKQDDVPPMSEIELVRHVCAEVERMAMVDRGGEVEGGLVERADVISLVEARRSTGLLEQLGHSLKKLVWA